MRRALLRLASRALVRGADRALDLHDVLLRAAGTVDGLVHDTAPIVVDSAQSVPELHDLHVRLAVVERGLDLCPGHGSNPHRNGEPYVCEAVRIQFDRLGCETTGCGFKPAAPVAP